MLQITKRKKFLAVVIFIILILSIFFKPWKLMFKEENKLTKDNNISFFIIDSNKYSLYGKKMIAIKSDSGDKKMIIDSIISDLSLALENNQNTFGTLAEMDFEEINSLFDYTHFDNQSIKKSKENLSLFLNTIKEKSSMINDEDLNYLLDFYFYYSCVVSFNKCWYLQPQIPISKTLVKGLLNHSLRLKQIYNLDTTANILEPLKVNFISSEYCKVEKNASDEFLSTIMVMPMLSKDHPRNLEAKNLISLRKLIATNPSYSLCVFYIP